MIIVKELGILYFQRFKIFHANLDRYMKIYFYSFVIFALLILSAFLPSTLVKPIKTPLETFSIFGFAIGFLLFSLNKYRENEKSRLTKFLTLVLHAFILLISAMLAQNFIAISLGLPPQDFNLTLSFFSLILYPIALLFFVSIFIGIVGIFYQIKTILLLFQGKSIGKYGVSVAHSIGAVGVLLMISVTTKYIGDKEPEIAGMIKWVAYFSDYQILKNYPNLPSGVRVRLHENGIYSTARVKDGSIKIDVSKYDSN